MFTRLWAWLKSLFEVIFPPDVSDWRLMPYQPFLFTSAWVAGIVLLVWGDFMSYPRMEILADVGLGVLPVTWLVLLVVAPPLALLSSWLILKRTGKKRYFGFWTRLIADLMVSCALVAYLPPRLALGDFHILPFSVFAGAALFSLCLVYRDVRTLVVNERLAHRLWKGGKGRDGGG